MIQPVVMGLPSLFWRSSQLDLRSSIVRLSLRWRRVADDQTVGSSFDERLTRWQMITRSLLNPIPGIRDLLLRRLSALDIGRYHARSGREFRRDRLRNKHVPLFHHRRSGRR